jgi:hypothetical protein
MVRWVVLIVVGCCGVAEARKRGPGLHDLRFESEKHGEVVRALDTCARSLAVEWRARPYEEIGNFYSARWCDGAGARADCQIASGSAHRRDLRSIELSTLYYPRAPRDVFGLVFNALMVPPKSGWGAQLSVSTGGKSILGDGFHLSLSRYDAARGQPALQIHLGSVYEYEIHATKVEHRERGTPLALRRRFLESPTALRDLGARSLIALEQKVLAELDARRARKCRYERKGPGAPLCHEEPLTGAEQKAARAKAIAHFSRLRGQLDRDYRAMHAAARAVTMAEACWPR